jgi:hypothetical protein
MALQHSPEALQVAVCITGRRSFLFEAVACGKLINVVKSAGIFDRIVEIGYIITLLV